MAGLISVVLLLLFIIGVVVRGGLSTAGPTPRPTRIRTAAQDLAMTWLLAGLVAGIISGAVSWLISLLYNGLYTGGLLNELTTFAAFTALIVFLPGIDRRDRRPLADRPAGREDARETPRPWRKERDGDGDVFSAVRGDESPTGEIPVQRGDAQTEARTASVATAEREARTETPDARGTTQELRTHEGRTEAGRRTRRVPRRSAPAAVSHPPRRSAWTRTPLNSATSGVRRRPGSAGRAGSPGFPARRSPRSPPG